MADDSATLASIRAEGAKGGEYTSIENFQARTGANSAVIKALMEAGCLNGLPETDQLCLF